MMTSRKTCLGCRQPINDPYVMEVGQEFWHERCLVCHICRTTLETKCYQRDGKLLCKNDYDRADESDSRIQIIGVSDSCHQQLKFHGLFTMKIPHHKLYGIKCSLCSQLVPRREFVMRVLGNIYHMECFICTPCARPLQKGEAFVIRNGKLICSLCLDRETMTYQHCMTFGPMLSMPKGDENMMMISHLHTAADTARRGPKRPRTILSSHQRRAFKTSFEVSPKPCRKVRESLAKDLGLSVRVVQVWFQNQRAKIKKLQRRQLTQTQQNSATNSEKNGTDDEDDSHSHLDSSMDEDLISSDDENPTSDAPAELRGKKGRKSSDGNRKGKNKNPIKNVPNSDDLDRKEVFNQSAVDFISNAFSLQLDTLNSLATSPDSSVCDIGDHDNLAESDGRIAASKLDSSEKVAKGQLNPMDGLYSMQSSYFNV